MDILLLPALTNIWLGGGRSPCGHSWKVAVLTTFGANFCLFPPVLPRGGMPASPKGWPSLYRDPQDCDKGARTSLWVIYQLYEGAESQRGKAPLMGLASTGPKLPVHCAHFCDAGKVPVDPVLGSELSYTTSHVNTSWESNS